MKAPVLHHRSATGLLSLAFLWQRPQLELVREMCRAGISAVPCKVASIGLDQSHLNRPLAALVPHLADLQSRLGVHPCGEGGEYESLVLSCPLFSGGAELDLVAPAPTPDDPSGQSHTMEILAVSVRSGVRATLIGSAATVAEQQPRGAPTAADLGDPQGDGEFPHRPAPPAVHGASAHTATRGYHAVAMSHRGPIQTLIAEIPVDDVPRIAFVHLWVPDMRAFADLNVAFASVFRGCAHAPSRTCIQGGTDGVAVLECCEGRPGAEVLVSV